MLTGNAYYPDPVVVLRAPFTAAGYSVHAIPIAFLGYPYGAAGRGGGTARFWPQPAVLPPQITIDRTTANEGDTGTEPAVLTVSLSHASTQTVSVDYATANGTAHGGPDNPEQAGTLINLGLALIEFPDLDAAEKAFTESLRIWEKNYGRDYPGAQVALAGIGSVHVLQGRLDRAEEELTEVKTADDKRGAKDDASLFYWLGEARRSRKDASGAVSLDREALHRAQHETGENSRYTALAHHYLGLALRDSGDMAGAEQELRAALASFTYIPHAEHPWAATTRLELAKLLVARSDAGDEIRRLMVDAAGIRMQFFGADDPRTFEARNALAALDGSN